MIIDCGAFFDSFRILGVFRVMAWFLTPGSGFPAVSAMEDMGQEEQEQHDTDEAESRGFEVVIVEIGIAGVMGIMGILRPEGVPVVDGRIQIEDPEAASRTVVSLNNEFPQTVAIKIAEGNRFIAQIEGIEIGGGPEKKIATIIQDTEEAMMGKCRFTGHNDIRQTVSIQICQRRTPKRKRRRVFLYLLRPPLFLLSRSSIETVNQ